MDSRPVPIPRLPSKPRERPRRVKTYTGCWTCRRRRVKCDEARPTCRRCDAGNFTCEGYDIKLTWTNQPSTTDANDKSDSVASSAYSQRSSVRANNPRRTPTVAAEDIPSILNDLDGARSGRSLKSKGPFSVFSINSTVPLERTPPDYRLSIQNLVEPAILSSTDMGRSSSDPPPARHLSEPTTFISYNPHAPESEETLADMELDEIEQAGTQSATANISRIPRRARSSDFEEVEVAAMGFRKE